MIRAISDKADNNAAVDYPTCPAYESNAIRHSANLLTEIIRLD